MIDEFEVLEDRVREGKLHQEIFDYLRHLMQHCDIDFVFTGTYRIVEIAKRYWSVLFNAALSKELELLTRLETYSLAREPVAGYFEYDDYALRKIWQVTAGHPFFVQLLCRELISYGNKNQISYFTVQDVNDIIDDLLQVGDIHLGYIWNELTNTKEARILLAVLSELVHTREIAVLTEIQATLDRYEVSLDLDEILRELKARGIIKEHEGRYSFKIGLVGKWIYETRSIESLV
jgi:type I restriction enzyme M protein